MLCLCSGFLLVGNQQWEGNTKAPVLCQEPLLVLLQGGTALPSVPFSYKAPRAQRAGSTFTPLQLLIRNFNQKKGADLTA